MFRGLGFRVCLEKFQIHGRYYRYSIAVSAESVFVLVVNILSTFKAATCWFPTYCKSSPKNLTEALSEAMQSPPPAPHQYPKAQRNHRKYPESRCSSKIRHWGFGSDILLYPYEFSKP